MSIYDNILKSKKEGKKIFAILIDPDKQTNEELLETVDIANNSNVDYIFVGGSLLINNSLLSNFPFLSSPL